MHSCIKEYELLENGFCNYLALHIHSIERNCDCIDDYITFVLKNRNNSKMGSAPFLRFLFIPWKRIVFYSSHRKKKNGNCLHISNSSQIAGVNGPYLS